MGQKTRLSLTDVGISLALMVVLATRGVRTEITGVRLETGNVPPGEESGGPQWTRIHRTARVGVEGDKQTANNVSLNQLADNLDRLEGNLASLIQSFLSLQRSVFNLEQLQELLVLLLEDILKQSGSLDPGGGLVDPSTDPGSSASKESVDKDDGVNSAEIDQDGDDTNDNNEKEEEDDDGKGGQKGTINGGGGGNGDHGTDPFGALKEIEINTPPTTSRLESTRGETLTENNKQQTREDRDDDDDDGYPGSDEYVSREMAESRESAESDEIIQRVNTVRPKNNSPSMRESVIPRKPLAQEPLVTFDAELEARLNDMLLRLAPVHTDHSSRMALMHNADSRAFLINTGESPMAPPPRFEPLEMVPGHNAVPAKDLEESQPVRVQLQRQQMSPIISHGGPRVGPEDFSSHFMENLGGDVKVGAESLNERSTGMINNMMQFGQSGQVPPPAATQPRQPPRQQPETLPSLMDRRRRQTQAASQTTYSFNPSSIQEPAVHISLINLTNNNSNINTTRAIKSTIAQTSSDKVTAPPLQTIPTPIDEFDELIANLLHDLSQHLQKQYLHHKQNATVGKDIDKAVIELNNLIWIPSSTTQKVTTTSSNSESNKTAETVTASVPLEQNNGKNNIPQAHAFSPRKNPKHMAASQMDHTSGNNSSNPGVSPYETQQNGSHVLTDETYGLTQLQHIQNETTQNESATIKSDQWDWLRQIPRVDPARQVNMEWLIGTLSTVSQLTTFSDELKSISERGKQLAKDLEKDNAQNQNKDISQSREDNTQSSENNAESDEDNMQYHEGNTQFNEDNTPSHEDNMQSHEDNTQSNEDNTQSLEERDSQEESLSEDLDDDGSEIENIEATFEENEEINLPIKEFHIEDNVVMEQKGSNIKETMRSKVDLQGSDSILGTTSINDNNNDNSEMNAANTQEGNDYKDDDEGEKYEDAKTDDKVKKIARDSDEDDNDNNDGDDNDDDDIGEEEVVGDKSSEGDNSNSMDTDSIGKSDQSTKYVTKPSENKKIMDMKTNSDTKPRHDKHSNDSHSAESSEEMTKDIDDDDDSVKEKDRQSDEMSSFESMVNAYSVKALDHFDTLLMESQKQYSNVVNQRNLDTHAVKKRRAQYGMSLAPLQNVMRKSNQAHNWNAQSHRIKKRQVPSFWDFLNVNNQPQHNSQTSLPFGSQLNLGMNLANPFSTEQNQQPHSALHNLLHSQSLFIPQPGQSMLQNPQNDQFPIPNQRAAQSPLDNIQFGTLPVGTPSLRGQMPHQTPGKLPLTSFNQQQQTNAFWPPSPLSGNFPFQPPIGGYPQYHGYNGRFHYPQFGYPGNSGSNYEPGESPAAEAAADMEEVLTNLFNRYWENVRNLLNPNGPSTTPENEYEGPITTPPVTTKTTATSTTTRTKGTTSATTRSTTRPTTLTTMKMETSNATTQPPTTSGATNSTILLSMLNETQGLELNVTSNLNATHSNTTISISTTDNASNSTNISPNVTSVPTFTMTSQSSPVKHTTIPTVPQSRDSTFLFNLIKSLEMMTLKPSI